MRILITNDDGINAPGLTILEAIAKKLTSPQGQSWVVAPASEQSGVGHCINYTRPMLVTQLDARRFSVEGSPADCVLVGLHEVMQDSPPDVILSGVNRGNNSAENALYSGTLGGAMEAALQGHLGIAMSQYFGPENVSIDNPFEAAEQHGVAAIKHILEKDPGTDAYRLFYNVNFPPVPGDAVKGTRITTQGKRPDTRFSVQGHNSPSGRRFLWIKGGNQHVPTAEGSDAKANLDGYISITPMRADLTAHDILDSLKALE
ncbi:MAG: 5'/3'-nucleotidase SurE [Paracoccaceae bacterium]|nr:5'/3'-nucleotidase SurE [Paracoccaceae bacterium]